jgi:hypothetical protein
VKLFNAIAIFDVYVVAETSEEARAALLRWIADDEDSLHSEVVATETSRMGAIRDAWRDQRPLVAADISDEGFEQLKGKTTIEVFKQLYTKQ